MVAGALVLRHACDLAVLNTLSVTMSANTVALEATRDALLGAAPIAPCLAVRDTETKCGVSWTSWRTTCGGNARSISVSWVPYIARRTGTPNYALLSAKHGYWSVARQRAGRTAGVEILSRLMLAPHTLAFCNADAPRIANVATLTDASAPLVQDGGSGEVGFAEDIWSVKTNYRTFPLTAGGALHCFPSTHCNKAAKQKPCAASVHGRITVNL